MASSTVAVTRRFDKDLLVEFDSTADAIGTIRNRMRRRKSVVLVFQIENFHAEKRRLLQCI